MNRVIIKAPRSGHTMHERLYGTTYNKPNKIISHNIEYDNGIMSPDITVYKSPEISGGNESEIMLRQEFTCPRFTSYK